MHPDVIGIGPAKCGTWWVYFQMAAHPQVWMPLTKEMRYFDKDIPLGQNHDKSDEWYLSQFRNCPEGKITGEITPSYILSKIAPVAIKKLLPHVKVFAILRNPVQRAISHWNMVRNLNFTKEDFWTCFSKDFDFIRSIGHYTQHLRRFDDLKIFWYDDLQNDPKQFIRGFYEYVGIDNTFVSNTVDKKLDYVDNPKFEKKLNKVVTSISKKNELVDYYRQEVTDLEQYLQVKLDHWKNPKLL